MKFFLVILGLVLVIQNACAWPTHHTTHGSSHRCSPFDEEEEICETNHGAECVPLVVRPRDIPRPSVSVPVLNPVPGPCAHKKTIVKPAVIPKPVCLSHSHKSVIDSSHSHSTNIHHHIDNYVSGSHTLTGCGGSTGTYISGGSSGSGNYVSGGCSGSGSGTYVSGGCSGSGTYVSGSSSGTSVSGASTGTYISGGNYITQGTPADAVSLNLAYKLARQDCGYHAQSEDKIAFGFKKIPIEMPHKRIVKPSIPEEKIYSLNGQIVELKPVCVSSHKSLDEEAAEDLLAMEAEEHAIEMEQTPIKKLYLEEIGYGPAKKTSTQFVDVPATTVVHGDSCSSSTHVSGCGCCGSKSKCTEYIPGNVEYKVIPKVDDIVIKLPEPEDSAESAEINISREQHEEECGCACHCTPICVHKSHNRKHRKSSVYIEKYHC